MLSDILDKWITFGLIEELRIKLLEISLLELNLKNVIGNDR
jgi:hypothetical protein